MGTVKQQLASETVSSNVEFNIRPTCVYVPWPVSLLSLTRNLGAGESSQWEEQPGDGQRSSISGTHKWNERVEDFDGGRIM